MSPLPPRPLDALNSILSSVDSVRNGVALGVLLGTFSAAGLLLAMADAAVASEHNIATVLYAGAALGLAFYGGNATGLLLMDDAAGRRPRPLATALRDARV